MMNSSSRGSEDEPRVSIVSVDHPGAALVPPPSSTASNNVGSGSSGSQAAPKVRRVTEKAPLLSQRRLFNSLSGLANGLTSPGGDSNDGYTEFGSSGASLTPPSSTPRTLDTFAGVFCPVALSMFSALLFLRVGFIVGNAGLFNTLIQFAIAYTILLFTVLSICAISTNGAVEGGGAYFMISRTLGPEFGGAIGALFIFANVVSSALYITGCVEGVVDNFGVGGLLDQGLPTDHWYRFLYCSVVNMLNLVVCLVGASLFAKTSVAVLTVVGVCLLSVIVSFFRGPFAVPLPEGNHLVNGTNGTAATGNFTGFNPTTFSENLHPTYGRDYTSSDGPVVNFAIVFGVLFSGVTGIMAGANMSGELVNPGRSIPKGTISAVGFTFFVYVLLSFLAAASCSNFLLQNDYIFMMGINFWPPFVTIGILTATFSASLSNLIGASRVLEAVAKDDIFGPVLRFLNAGTTRSGNPVAAVFVCFVVVELFLLIGSLNAIAQLNSVLFLLSYFAMNLACLGLDLASAPNFRPAFRYWSAKTAFIGMIGTLAMMFVINAIYASLSIIACLVLVISLHLLSPSKTSNWGSLSQALIFHQVRKYLLLLDSRKEHVKFWRPQMLLMVANPRSACPMIDFVNDLKKSGLYVLGHVYQGEFDDMESDPSSDDFPAWLSLVDHLKVKAFIELTVARSFREGMHHLIRISGLGAMRPNTIVLGFHDDATPVDFFGSGDNDIPLNYRTDKFSQETFVLRKEKRLSLDEYMHAIRDVIKMNKNVVLCRNMALLDKGKVARKKQLFIDIWPINFFSGDANSLMDTSSLFLLQLACVLNMTSSWKSLTLRVFLLCTSSTTSAEAGSREAELRRMLQILRIKARIVVIPWDAVLGKQIPSGSEPHFSLMDSAPQWPLNSIKPDYITAVNAMIKEQCMSTAVSFLFLPELPVDKSEDALYFNHLTSLSQDIGPLAYVHGVSTVTSTTI